MASVKVTRKDLGMDAIFQRMREINRMSLTVGVQGKQGATIIRGKRRDATTVNLAQIALFNEFGTEDIPARSFLRGALFANKAQIETVIAETMGKFVTRPKMDPVAALAIIGKFVAGRVKARINTPGLWAKPNAPSTIAAKGFNRPLHDTGKLARSISWAVRAGGDGGPILRQGKA